MPEVLLDKYRKSELSSHLSDLMREHSRLLKLNGISSSMASCILASTLPNQERKALIIIPDREEAAYFYNDLQHFIPSDRLFFYPVKNKNADGESREVDSLECTLALKSISSVKGFMAIVTYPEALLQLFPDVRELESHSLTVRKGENINMEELVEYLNDLRFERSDFVAMPGQFSWRGGIIDLFSYDSNNAVRMEFNGDIIESLRTIDIENQLTMAEIQNISITADAGKVEAEKYLTILENMPPDALFVARDLKVVLEKISAQVRKEVTAETGKQANIILKDIEEKFRNGRILIEFGQFPEYEADEVLTWDSSPQPSFNKNFDLLAEDLRAYQKKGYETYITASDSNQVRRFHEIFEDIGKGVHINPVISSLHEGFIDHSNKIICYTDHQLFGRYHKFRLRNSFADKSASLNLRELMGLRTGDYITHIDHGVGKFSGLEKIEVNGKKQEAIRIIYRNSDVLYISIHSLHRISKYVGKDGTEPKLDKLGSQAWKNLKQKTKSRVKELAFDLIKLYAKRKARKGFAFSPDSYLQTELEASFMYEDTADQFKATKDVKADMEANFPMDRLICGDVGFGKTEIAIRAAFKSINDRKQVAVLVPTTILAMQHYKTFGKRLENFPCKVDYLNRFRSAADQKLIFNGLTDGSIDIIIGTHKLLSEQLKFRDLGLLIIDEEQKFGVGAKDKLKTLKTDVDTLTLTATPIPRTLQFSMMGARDLSIINTPPPNRLPIETHLHEFDEVLIREAIDYEVSRGGQVFFINNRIQNISEIGNLVEKLCPGVRVLIAHGQLKGHELEQKMTSFIEGEFDVLVSTTIVESGLDIPNANTIIINQANFFGLSDLHQMRGRVGRSNRKAFCYLLIPPPSTLTSLALKRLKAIEQFSDLGSGFQTSMRDLDIRGAGDIFGAEQSGFISEIGFDMYQKILQEAITELKENEFKDVFKTEIHSTSASDCQIETDLEILIPDNYVSHIGERLILYRELDEKDDEEGLEHSKKSMIDRFGPMPKACEDLFETIRLRWRAKSLGIERIILKNGVLICYFLAKQDSPFYQSDKFQDILQFVQSNPSRCKMVEKNERLSLRIGGIPGINDALKVLASLSRVTA